MDRISFFTNKFVQPKVMVHSANLSVHEKNGI